MNDKIKFAIKVSLSLTLAYLIPFAMGWPQASTAATTVMLIASTGSRRESLAKGTLRVFGTLVGAVVGLLLVPFPFSFEWLVHHKPGEVCSGLCLHQTTIRWMLSLHCA